ncbi:dihydrolipoyllysine-residue acetyltransferase [Suttonella ornithocola]|uniref:Acetyltransferase component of pyruvate dehydrogenase complex n=1 Tax=Suttonella ornithocola TaxID=279832 RepID=A0A380MQ05_9GAMM|nr:dihydrolipoyllysine-residue acetyltransferase [Suttonella ornithocola]SUO93397.1 Dihydrolipoyllysine-residue acetyltransferase component of pyruvate dehydrogenase complex [Suttonella ornithocola]
MSIEIRVPDIGDFDAVDVIEVLIKAGDTIEVDQSVLVLESDKASMEVPASAAGTVESVKIKVGDKVKKGDVIATLAGEDNSASQQSEEKASEQKEAPKNTDNNAPTASEQSETVELKVPDIGDFDSVSVIEVNVTEGQDIQVDDTLITLESDKASMEVPAEAAGKLLSLKVKVGDNVSKGDVIALVQTGEKNHIADESANKKAQTSANKTGKAESVPSSSTEKTQATTPVSTTNAEKIDEAAFAKAYASPAVRRFARELGADLGKISGSGRNNRILEEDVKKFVKQALSNLDNSNSAAPATGSGIPPIPAVDFSKFGAVEEQKLSRINILTGEAMTRCWLNIPHVTQHDMCDITELEDFRKSLKAEAEKKGVRVTMLAFLMKALVAGLKEFPRFNSSLSSDGKSLIMKKYYNIGIAVDTPNGLVVPVIKEVDQKGIYELSSDLMEISKKARDGKLSPKDMSGASMTISSLGGIGGQYFTPIVNAPEVAILGVSRSTLQPIWNGKTFEPRLMLPLSMSYDHRVIDGALGARMIVFLGQMLTDMKKALL